MYLEIRMQLNSIQSAMRSLSKTDVVQAQDPKRRIDWRKAVVLRDVKEGVDTTVPIKFVGSSTEHLLPWKSIRQPNPSKPIKPIPSGPVIVLDSDDDAPNTQPPQPPSADQHASAPTAITSSKPIPVYQTASQPAPQPSNGIHFPSENVDHQLARFNNLNHPDHLYITDPYLDVPKPDSSAFQQHTGSYPTQNHRNYLNRPPQPSTATEPANESHTTNVQPQSQPQPHHHQHHHHHDYGPRALHNLHSQWSEPTSDRRPPPSHQPDDPPLHRRTHPPHSHFPPEHSTRPAGIQPQQPAERPRRLPENFEPPPYRDNLHVYSNHRHQPAEGTAIPPAEFAHPASERMNNSRPIPASSRPHRPTGRTQPRQQPPLARENTGVEQQPQPAATSANAQHESVRGVLNHFMSIPRHPQVQNQDVFRVRVPRVPRANGDVEPSATVRDARAESANGRRSRDDHDRDIPVSGLSRSTAPALAASRSAGTLPFPSRTGRRTSINGKRPVENGKEKDKGKGKERDGSKTKPSNRVLKRKKTMQTPRSSSLPAKRSSVENVFFSKRFRTRENRQSDRRNIPLDGPLDHRELVDAAKKSLSLFEPRNPISVLNPKVTGSEEELVADITMDEETLDQLGRMSISSNIVMGKLVPPTKRRKSGNPIKHRARFVVQSSEPIARTQNPVRKNSEFGPRRFISSPLSDNSDDDDDDDDDDDNDDDDDVPAFTLVHQCICGVREEPVSDIPGRAGSIQCSRCCLWSHLRCTQLTEDEVSKFRKKKRFLCWDCFESIIPPPVLPTANRYAGRNWGIQVKPISSLIVHADEIEFADFLKKQSGRRSARTTLTKAEQEDRAKNVEALRQGLVRPSVGDRERALFDIQLVEEDLAMLLL